MGPCQTPNEDIREPVKDGVRKPSAVRTPRGRHRGGKPCCGTEVKKSTAGRRKETELGAETEDEEAKEDTGIRLIVHIGVTEGEGEVNLEMALGVESEGEEEGKG